jgi:hypothetical protein
VGRESRESLSVRKYGSAFIAGDISLINTDESVKHGRVLHRIGLSREFVSFSSAGKEFFKDIRSEGEGQDSSSYSGSRRISFVPQREGLKNERDSFSG